jgi:hypothetical protein
MIKDPFLRLRNYPHAGGTRPATCNRLHSVPYERSRKSVACIIITNGERREEVPPILT